MKKQNWWAAQERFIGQWDGQAWGLAACHYPSLRPYCAAGARDGGLWIVVNQELLKYHAQRVDIKTAH